MPSRLCSAAELFEFDRPKFKSPCPIPCQREPPTVHGSSLTVANPVRPVSWLTPAKPPPEPLGNRNAVYSAVFIVPESGSREKTLIAPAAPPRAGPLQLPPEKASCN